MSHLGLIRLNETLSKIISHLRYPMNSRDLTPLKSIPLSRINLPHSSPSILNDTHVTRQGYAIRINWRLSPARNTRPRWHWAMPRERERLWGTGVCRVGWYRPLGKPSPGSSSMRRWAHAKGSRAKAPLWYASCRASLRPPPQVHLCAWQIPWACWHTMHIVIQKKSLWAFELVEIEQSKICQ